MNSEVWKKNTKFKQTEIGKIPEDWKLIKVEDIKSQDARSIISGPFGSNIGRKYFVDSGVPVIRGNNITTGFQKFIDKGFVFITPEKANELNTWAERDDLVFTAAGTLGQVGIIPKNSKYERYIISNKQLRLRVDKDIINPLFAFYWFSTPKMVQLIKRRDTGSTIPLINLSVLKNLPVVVPPLEEQNAILSILCSLDDKISLNQRMNKTLEAIAQAIFKHWFVDFEFPNEEGKPYKSSGGEMVYNEELGKEIPKGWEVYYLEDLTEKFTTGLNPRKNFVLGKGNNFYVTIKNMDNQRVILDERCDKIDDEAIKKINARSNLEKDDILFSGIGTIGRTFYIDETPKNWNISESIFTLRAKKDKITSIILYYLLLSSDFQRYAIQLASGSVQRGIRMADLKKYKVALPKIEKQKEYSEVLNAILKQFKFNIKQIDLLSQIRDALLPKLMSGEIRVKVDEVENEVRDAEEQT